VLLACVVLIAQHSEFDTNCSIVFINATIRPETTTDQAQFTRRGRVKEQATSLVSYPAYEVIYNIANARTCVE